MVKENAISVEENMSLKKKNARHGGKSAQLAVKRTTYRKSANRKGEENRRKYTELKNKKKAMPVMSTS